MANARMINVGQLVREHASKKNVVLVGFGIQWKCYSEQKGGGENMERMTGPPAIEGSWDNLLHRQNNGNNSLIIFREEEDDNNIINDKSKDHRDDEDIVRSTIRKKAKGQLV